MTVTGEQFSEFGKELRAVFECNKTMNKTDKTDLTQFEGRLDTCHRIISDMCENYRGFKMQIPAKRDKYNEDLYFSDTLDLSKKIASELKAEREENTRLKAEVERLREALSNVRLDICEAGVVVFRINPPSETTFDYIGRVLGDEVTWEEWEARAALKGE